MSEMHFFSFNGARPQFENNALKIIEEQKTGVHSCS